MATCEEGLRDLVFAGAAVVVFASAGAALFGRVSRSTLAALTGLVAVAAGAAWVVFALEPTRDARGRRRRADCLRRTRARHARASAARRARAGCRSQLDRAETRLDALVARETEAHVAEIERTLARARADSLSRLVAEERRIGEERRSALVERENKASAELSEALAQVEQRVGRRLTEWTGDLERTEQSLAAKLTGLAQRQEQLMAEAKSHHRARHRAPRHGQRGQRERLAALATGVRPVGARDRTGHAGGLGGTRARPAPGACTRSPTGSVIASGSSPSASRRGGRGDPADPGRLRRHRAPPARPAQARRRTDRETAFSEAVSQQFDVVIKSAREDAAQRLSRELDRAVATSPRRRRESWPSASPTLPMPAASARAQALGDRQHAGARAGRARQRASSVESATPRWPCARRFRRWQPTPRPERTVAERAPPGISSAASTTHSTRLAPGSLPRFAAR